MSVEFRITRDLLMIIHAHLSRLHRFAAERVGFIACAASETQEGGLLLLAETFHPVLDDHYIDDPRVGAMMGSTAIRNALQIAYCRSVSMFHVHRHEHFGSPWFSSVDLRESGRFIPDFWKVQPQRPHGTLVLSHDSIAGLCWIPGRPLPVRIQKVSVVGRPTSTTEITA